MTRLESKYFLAEPIDLRVHILLIRTDLTGNLVDNDYIYKVNFEETETHESQANKMLIKQLKAELK